MKVLMVNTPQSVKFRGGDTTQMVKTADALRAMGHQVDISTDAEPKATGYDIAHVFNVRTIAVTPRQIATMKKQGVPVVLSPIYLNPSVALWGGSAIEHIFAVAKGEGQMDKLMPALKNRTLKVRWRDRTLFRADTENRPQGRYDEMERATVRMVDWLLPNSYLQHHWMIRTLNVADVPFTVVPYAADSGVFLDPDPEPFIRKTGLKDFILTVGRVELSKNQVMLAYAMRKAEVPMVFIGGCLQKRYLRWCKQWGPKSLFYFPHVEHNELRSAYAAARVHALPSWIETCGLVHMEAALANCSLVMSTAGFEVEYYRSYGEYCDPADPDSIHSAVVRAYQNHAANVSRREALKQLIMKEYTWERAAELSLSAYQAVLARRKHAAAKQASPAAPAISVAKPAKRRKGAVKEGGRRNPKLNSKI